MANPNKPQPIIDILTNNRDKLLKYLEEFHTDKGKRVVQWGVVAITGCNWRRW